MNRTLAKIVSLPGTVIHSLVIPLFAFLFTLYYQPRMEYDILSMPHSSFAFNVTILFCIKIVHRDEAGLLVAELELDGFESIPISRKYQDEITKLL